MDYTKARTILLYCCFSCSQGFLCLLFSRYLNCGCVNNTILSSSSSGNYIGSSIVGLISFRGHPCRVSRICVRSFIIITVTFRF